MHNNPRRFHAVHSDLFLEPQQNRVACTMLIVSQVMVERQLLDAAGLEEGDNFLGPERAYPAWRSVALVVQEYLHFAAQLSFFDRDAQPLCIRYSSQSE
jgi:hypothetical protein